MSRSGDGGSAGFQPFGEPPPVGALAVLHLATDPELERVTGMYFDPMSARPPSVAATDPGLRLALWTQSQRLLASAGHPGAFAAPPGGKPASARSPAPAPRPRRAPARRRRSPERRRSSFPERHRPDDRRTP